MSGEKFNIEIRESDLPDNLKGVAGSDFLKKGEVGNLNVYLTSKGVIVFKNGNLIGSINEKGLEKQSKEILNSISGVGSDHMMFLGGFFVPYCRESKKYGNDGENHHLGDEVFKCPWCETKFEIEEFNLTHKDIDETTYGASSYTSGKKVFHKIKDIDEFRRKGSGLIEEEFD